MAEKYKKHLPKDLQDRFEKAVRDKDLLNLSEGIALYNVRIGKLLENLPGDEGEELIATFEGLVAASRAIRRDYDKLIKGDGFADGEAIASLGKHVNDMEAHVAAIGELKGLEHLVWGDVFKLLQQQGKLITREVDRRKAMLAYLTVEEGMAMVSALEKAVNETVSDPQERKAVAAKFYRYFTPSTG